MPSVFESLAFRHKRKAMATGRVASGHVCPKCGDARRQDVLDIRADSQMTIVRLLCANCECVWTIEPVGGARAFWAKTSDGDIDRGEIA